MRAMMGSFRGWANVWFPSSLDWFVHCLTDLCNVFEPQAVLGPLDKLRRKLPAFPMDSPFNT